MQRRLFQVFHLDDHVWNLRSYAKLLIHEATHGLLFKKGIAYNKKNREGIERLCNLEEYRFSRRFEPGYADAHRAPFNAAYYKWYWEGSPHSKVAAHWARFREAFRLRKKKYGTSPADAKAYNELGLSHRRKGDSDKAISYFSHAIQLDPTFAAAYYNRGYEYHCQGRYDEALADYDKAIELAPKFAGVYCNRGLTYRHQGEYDRAIAEYDRAIQLDPQFALAYNNRGYAYHCKREYDRAIEDYDRALQIDPRLVLGYINRGRTYRDLRNYGKAIADYSRLIELAPKNASAYNNLAWLLANCPSADFRETAKAIENALKSCELYEWKHPSALNTLAMSYAAAGDFDQAAKWQSRYLELPDLSPDDMALARKLLAWYQASKSNQVDK